MSTWYKLQKDCLSIDADDLNILVTKDEQGNNYIVLSLTDIKDLINEYSKKTGK